MPKTEQQSDIATILAKSASGETLSKIEINALKRHRDGKDLTPTQKNKFVGLLNDELDRNNEEKRRFKLTTTKTDAGTAPNQKALASILGITRKTVNRWTQEPEFPKQNEDGTWNVEDVKLWAHKRGKKLEGANAMPNKSSAQVEQILLQNQKLEIQIGVLQGNYYAKDEIAREVSQMVGNLRRVLYGLPATLAPQVVGANIANAENLLKDGIDEAFKELHQGDWTRVEDGAT